MSTDHQRYSLVNQKAAMSAYATAEGFEIVRSYADAGRSGVTTKRRSGLSELLADVVSGKAEFKTILVLDVSRWGRYQDADEAGHYEFLCRAAGVEVIYTAEGFTEGLAGSIYKHLKRVMAGEYSRELSAKVRASKTRLATSGNAPGGTCVYGLARQVIEPDGSLGKVLARGERKDRPEQAVQMIEEGPEQSRVLRRIFDLFLTEQLYPVRIAAKLNKEGIPWLDGTGWTPNRVSNVLRCDLVTGRQPFGKTTHLLGQPIRYNARDTWGSVRVFGPIVSVKVFNAAAARLRALNGHHHKTDEELLDDLRAVYIKHGRLSNALMAATPNMHRHSAYRARFGSLENAFKLVGASYAARPRGRRPDGTRLSREEVLDRIRALYARHGTITMALCHADKSLPPLEYIRAEFGGLADSFEAAGITTHFSRGRRAFAKRPNIDPETGARDLGNGINIGVQGGRYFLTKNGTKRYGM
ncbi:MAG: recombinase family protein [Alphaproteobacteria bacterium]|nr:recombinase family protein [Alphaproteobacteria bacterium]MBU2380579.1 recombinase family protein [Alphaproteobacteria bacterium]